MNIEDIRTKYQCDASQTFAQWKEWVRKTKPSQAQAHIVKAVAPNGSKYERLIGGYTDAQNVAFDLASHGYKDVKLYHSVNAGPLKLLRNFSAPLHGAKFKDGADAVDPIHEKYEKDYNPILGQEFSGNGKEFNNILRNKQYEGLYKQIDFYLRHYAKQKKLSDVQMKDLKRLVSQIRSYGKNGERWVNEVKKTIKEFKDSVEEIGDATATFPVKSNRNGNNKYGFIEKICRSEAEAKALVDKLKKEGFVANYKKVMYRDEADGVEQIRAKYCMDAAGAGVVNPNFKFQTNVEKRLATTRRGRAMTLPQYGKPSKVYVGKDGNFFAVFNTSGQKLSKTPFKTASEAESFARKNGWMVERR